MNGRAKARAHANIALIKYWGKKDERLILPANSSLSLTLDAFYTETEIAFRPEISEDVFYLNGKLQPAERVSRFLDLFRKKAAIDSKAVVKSINFVPTAAGLASSAAGFAALAAAANAASGLNLDKKELSRYARRGSGSAARSIYGGFVEWQKGSDNSSYALPIDAASWDVGMVVVIVSGEKKQVSSRAGMKRTVETSPFYKGWLVSAELDLEKIKIAIKNRNLEEMGQIAERNGLKMHAAMLGANPPLLYWRPQSLLAIEQVKNMRREGIPCYFTMDAGPNVKIICRLSQAPLIKERLLEHFSENQIIITGPGPGAAVIAEESN